MQTNKMRVLKREFFSSFDKKSTVYSNLMHYLTMLLFILAWVVYFSAYFDGSYDPVNYRNLPKGLFFIRPFYHIISDENCIHTRCNLGDVVASSRFMQAAFSVMSLGAYWCSAIHTYFAVRFFKKGGFYARYRRSSRWGTRIKIAANILIVICIFLFLVAFSINGIGSFKSSSIKFGKPSKENEQLYPNYHGFVPTHKKMEQQLTYHLLFTGITFVCGLFGIVLMFFFNYFILNLLRATSSRNNKTAEFGSIEKEQNYTANANDKAFFISSYKKNKKRKSSIKSREKVNSDLLDTDNFNTLLNESIEKDESNDGNLQKSLTTTNQEKKEPYQKIKNESIIIKDCIRRNWNYFIAYLCCFTVTIVFVAMAQLNGRSASAANEIHFAPDPFLMSVANCKASACLTAPIFGLNWAEWMCAFICITFITLQTSVTKYLFIYF